MPYNYLYLSYAWEVNQLNYPFELGLLIGHVHVADNLKAIGATHSFLGHQFYF